MEKIVILSYNIYPYLHMPELKISGGAEQQLATLAKLLGENGCEVIFLTGDFGQPDFVKRENVSFFKFEKKSDGRIRKSIRFIQLLRQIQPDYVLERGSSMFTFLAAASCKLLRIPFVFCGASDINFAKNAIDPFFNKSKVKQRLYQWSLHHVTHFVVQKRKQAMLLKQNFGIRDNVSMIRNFPPDVVTDGAHEEKLYDAVWVANFIPYKQPELFIELARRHPQQKFLLIGSSGDKSYNDKIRLAAQSISNLKAVGYVAPDEVIHLIRKSKIIVNTTFVASGYEEGFSNVMLMGWICGLPTLTLISDPDDLIVSNKIGFRCGNFENLSSNFELLIHDSDLYSQMSRNALAYVNQNHNKENILQQYLRIIGRADARMISSPVALMQ